MSVVGIDFGAKNAVIAAPGRGGVDVILNGNSNRLNPCMVGFDRAREMGEGAASSATSNYRNTIYNMKRLVGLAYDDPNAQAEMKRVPFTCSPLKHAAGGPDSIGVKVMLNSEETTLPVEVVAGMMVKHLGRIAAAKAAASSSSPGASELLPQDWVIAVPSYYSDSQKRAFLQGCEIVGISGVQRLIHETTATALAYGIFKDIKNEFKKDNPTNVLFIDFGATSYQVAIVAFEPGKLIVKSSQFDANLGGRSIDQAIAEWLGNEFENKYKGKLSAKVTSKAKVMLKLLNAAEKAKKTLSPQGVKEVRVHLESLMDDLDFSITLKAANYEAMCAPFVQRLAPPIERALQEAKLTAKQLSSVEIVGGSTRVGFVKKALSKILGLNQRATNCGLSTTMNADESVCRGAALQSAILSPRFKVKPYEIIEYQPYPIKISWDEEAAERGVEVEGDANGAALPANSVIMFGRGSNFPVVRRVTLRREGEFMVTASYDESRAEFGFPAGSSAEICKFFIKAPVGGEHKVRVNVKHDINGVITLSGAQMVEEVDDEEPPAGEVKEGEDSAPKKKIKKTNLEASMKRPLEWTKAEFDKGYETEVSMSNADRIVRETSDMRNELESYIYAMRDKIVSESGLAPYLTESDRTTFSAVLEKSENWLYEDGFDTTKSVYAEKLTELKKFGDPIEFRQREAGGRNSAVSHLQKSVDKYKNWLNMSQSDENYAHVMEDERQKCYAKCDETLSWLHEMLDKQGSTPLTSNPVLTVGQIDIKIKELSSTVDPVMFKPKPKPKPEKPAEEKKTPAKEGTEGTNADGGKTANEPEPMDTSK